MTNAQQSETRVRQKEMVEQRMVQLQMHGPHQTLITKQSTMFLNQL